MLALAEACAAAQQPSLAVQVDHPTGKLGPTFYGLMTEEINYSYDGGIYAEMVRDRTITAQRGGLAHWTMVAYGDSDVAILVDSLSGPTQQSPQSMKVEVKRAQRECSRRRAECWLLGHGRSAEYDIHRLILGEDRQCRGTADLHNC